MPIPTVEKIVEEFKQTNIYQTARVSGYGRKMEDWLRTTLTTLQAKHAEELEKAVEAYQTRWPYTFLGNTANIGVTEEITEVCVFRRNSITHKIYDEYTFTLPPLAPTKTDKTTEV